MAMKQEAKIVLKAQDKTKLAFKSVNRGFGRMRKAMGGISKLLPALAVGFSAVAFVNFTKNAFKTADALGKTADKIGLTTKSLQELRFGASQSGVKVETLDMAMQRFSRRLGEAQRGTGELTGTLLEYGIAVKNVDGSSRSVDEVLSDVANTIMNAESSTERLRIAFKAFDSEGAALVNMLKGGALGLQLFRDQANELGIVMEDHLIRNAEETGNKFDILTKVMGIRFQSMLIELAPLIDKVAKALIDLFKPAKVTMEELLQVSDTLTDRLAANWEEIQKATKAYGKDSDAVKDLTKHHKGLQEQLRKVVYNIKVLKGEIVDLGEVTATGTTEIKDYKVQFDAHLESYKDVKPIRDFKDEFTNLNKVLANQTVSAMKKVEDSIIAITWGTKTAKEAFRDMAISILQDIQRIAMREATSGIAQAGFGFLKSLGSNLFGGFGGSPSIGGGHDFVLQGMQGGGHVNKNQPYMVGERGAELFVPQTSGEIVPHGAGGVTIQNIINVSTGVSQTVRAEVASLMPQISAMTTQAVADARARGAIS